jgi:transposase-like protein
MLDSIWRPPTRAAERDYVYVWVDGVHFNVRLEDDRLCTLVMIGVRPDGTKELITVEDGYRESAEKLEDGAPRPETSSDAPAGRGCR